MTTRRENVILALRLSSCHQCMYDKDEQYFHLPVIGEFSIEIRKGEKNACLSIRLFCIPKQIGKKIHAWHGCWNYRWTLEDLSLGEIFRANKRIVSAYMKSAPLNIPKNKENRGRENNFPFLNLVSISKCQKLLGTVRTEMISFSEHIQAKHWTCQWANSPNTNFSNRKRKKSVVVAIPFWKRINRLRESKRASKIKPELCL